MASAAISHQSLPTGGPTAGGDDLDDLFDYDGGMDDPNDPFGNNYQVPGQKKDSAVSKTSKEASKGGAGLGIDEEVEVTRKPRAPRPKLDEHRLLSAAGIPKLRRKARDHLKFKGKGHEYSDAARLLAFYQLWLDDLFPKARFLDALAMVEKTGHKRMMQSARIEWINEGKPQNEYRNEEGVQPRVGEEEKEKTAGRVAPIFEKAKETERAKTPQNGGGLFVDDDEDLYGATPRPAQRTQAAPITGSIFGPRSTFVDDGPPDDDVEALLAQEGAMQIDKPDNIAVKQLTVQQQPDDFEDDLDALMAEQEMEQALPPKKTVNKPVDDDFEDDLDALMAEQEADMSRASATEKLSASKKASHPQGDAFEDDLDALLAEEKVPGEKPASQVSNGLSIGGVDENMDVMAEMEGF